MSWLWQAACDVIALFSEALAWVAEAFDEENEPQ